MIGRTGARRGFTLIELLVVLAVVAALLSVAAPRYFRSIDLAREAALRSTLAATRDALDKHFTDTGHYPESLDALVQRRYLRALPVDPMQDTRDAWVLVPPPDGRPGIYDVRSSAQGVGQDGSAYGTW